MGQTKEDRYTTKLIDLSDDTEVAHTGGQNVQTLQPDVGFVYEVINISYNAPAVGTSGTHDLEMKYTGDLHYIVRVRSTFATAIAIKSLGFIGDSSEEPAATNDQYDLMRRGVLIATNGLPISIPYTNDTDVAQAGTRELLIVVKKYREAIP